MGLTCRAGDRYEGCCIEARRKLFPVKYRWKMKDRGNPLGLFYLLKYIFVKIPKKNTNSTATITPAAHPNSGAKRSNSSPASFKTLDTPHSAVAENPSVFRLKSKLFFLARSTTINISNPVNNSDVPGMGLVNAASNPAIRV